MTIRRQPFSAHVCLFVTTRTLLILCVHGLCQIDDAFSFKEFSREALCAEDAMSSTLKYDNMANIEMPKSLCLMRMQAKLFNGVSSDFSD